MQTALVKTRFFTTLVLLAVFVASCAPGTATLSPEPLANPIMESTVTVPAPTQLPTENVPILATETMEPTPLPIATSRGPNLEATDPTTVSLASGQLQFVEFFRFT